MRVARSPTPCPSSSARTPCCWSRFAVTKTRHRHRSASPTWLHQHGIKATSSVTVAAPNSWNVEQFLEVAAGQDADLIVAGGYGHTRLQEWVFGGFTRVLLAQTTRAVMFNH